MQEIVNLENYERLTLKELHPKGIENLVIAVVDRAANDYKIAMMRKSVAEDHVSVCQQEVERFLLSDWFYLLTGMDGKWVLQKLRRSYGR